MRQAARFVVAVQVVRHDDPSGWSAAAAGGVDKGIPLGMAASGGVHSGAAIKRSMPVGLAADPPNAHQLKIP
jgi:hypothetical protein